METPAPLTDADCPLLLRHGGAAARELMGRYAESLARLAAAAADPELAGLAGERLSAVTEPLRLARAKLARKRYVVGFIGLTQAGKSTTVNNILGEEVCKSGRTSDATSSQPARLLRAPENAVEVEYLTPERYAARRRAVCSALGLSAPPEKDDELLVLLDNPETFRQLGALGPRHRDDLAYLKDLLAAARRHGREYLRDPARAVAGIAYADRYEYTTHRPGEAGARELLLREARFLLDNSNLPDDLELCDLPGLDSKRTVDDLVTRDYLPELDGTFLFVNVGMNTQSAGMLGTLNLVANEFGGRAGSRAWVIFTKMDSLTSNHFKPDENIFRGLKDMLAGANVPAGQVCFCSNDVFAALAANPAPAEPRALASQLLKQTPAEPVPAVTPPEFRAAWEALLVDGGVGRIRALMTGEVGRALAGQIRLDASEQLERFDDGLARAAEAERARQDGGGQLLEWAMTCRAEVMSLADMLAARPDQFPAIAAEAEALKAELGQFLSNPATVRVVGGLSGDGLAGEFRLHAKQLNGTLNRRMTQSDRGGIEAIYDAVGASLSTLPAPPRGRVRSCGEEWQGYRKADRAGDWLDRGAFASPDFEDLLRKSDGLGGADYLELMHEKIGAAVRQTLHQVRARLRQRLDELKSYLTLLTAEPAEAP